MPAALLLLVFLGVAVVAVVVVLLLLAPDHPRWVVTRQHFALPATGTGAAVVGDRANEFPLPSDKATKYLSIIVPAYNEQSRIQRMLDETLAYCDARQRASPDFTWEIVVVDDGSSDRTAAEVLKYVEREGTDRLRLLVLPKNVGKGGAVKRGMMCGRGELLLMADADAATEISDFEKLERVLQELQHAEPPHMGVVVGSRAHLVNSDAVAKRAWYRNLPMHVFHFLVDNLCVRGIRDTQCGFKLFSRRAAHLLFHDLHIERWAFDVELLYLAQRRGIPAREVAVNWTEIDGSHLSLFGSSVQMFFDLLRIRFKYMLGKWQLASDITIAAK